MVDQPPNDRPSDVAISVEDLALTNSVVLQVLVSSLIRQKVIDGEKLSAALEHIAKNPPASDRPGITKALQSLIGALKALK